MIQGNDDKWLVVKLLSVEGKFVKAHEFGQQNEAEEELELTGPVFMAPLGTGRCRGSGWTVKKWPVLKGYKTAQDCAEACAKRKGCTAFDVSGAQADKTGCPL